MKCSCGGYIDEFNESQPCCGDCGSYGPGYDAIVSGSHDHYDNSDYDNHYYDFLYESSDEDYSSEAGWGAFDPGW